MAFRFTKDPEAVLPYTLNWAQWLEEGDTISGLDTGPGPGISVDSTDFTDTTTTLIISGGTADNIYHIGVHVFTAAGYEDERLLIFSVKER